MQRGYRHPRSLLPVVNTSVMAPTLAQIVEVCRKEFNLPADTTVMTAVSRACAELELNQTGLSLIARAKQCWEILGPATSPALAAYDGTPALPPDDADVLQKSAPQRSVKASYTKKAKHGAKEAAAAEAKEKREAAAAEAKAKREAAAAEAKEKREAAAAERAAAAAKAAADKAAMTVAVAAEKEAGRALAVATKAAAVAAAEAEARREDLEQAKKLVAELRKK